MAVLRSGNKKGSVLVFTLVLFFMMLTIAVGIAAVSVNERKNAGVTGSSTQSFQVADSASEMFITKMKSLSTIGQISQTPAGFDCDGVTHNLTGSISSGTYRITMLDVNGNQLNCDAGSAVLLTTIKKIKILGVHSGTVRAIEISVNSAPVASGNDAFTKLLLHADGAGNVFADSSASSTVLAPGASATQTGVRKKFGAASFLVSDNNSYLDFSGNDFNISSGAWTMDCWIYPTGNYIGDYIDIFNDGRGIWPNRWIWDFSLTAIRYASQNNAIVWNVPATINNNSWNHVAMASDGTTAYMFVNGALVGSRAAFNPAFFNTPAIARQAGTSVINNTNSYYIDEFRFSKGVARWTADFSGSLPIAAY